jgi:hypothetical protein
MSDVTESAQQLACWIRDYRNEKQPAFIADLQTVLDAIKRQPSIAKEVEQILLSDEFHAKFVEAFVNTPLPSMTVGVKQV